MCIRDSSVIRLSVLPVKSVTLQAVEFPNSPCGKYIEDNLEDDLKIEDIATKTLISPFYFQKAFRLLCGFTVGEYIRNRRLAAAGNDLLTTDEKIKMCIRDR